MEANFWRNWDLRIELITMHSNALQHTLIGILWRGISMFTMDV